MKTSLAVVLTLISVGLHAAHMGIIDIWTPDSFSEPYLVLGSDGRVYEVPEDRNHLLSKLYFAKDSNLLVNVITPETKLTDDVLETRSTIFDLIMYSKMYMRLDPKTQSNKNIPTPMDGYTATTLSSMKTARSYFGTMKRNLRKKSQCYNRAHIWTHELDNKFGAKTKKVWLFFTRKYIRAYRYHWWFHVTPVIQVADQSEDISLDRRYLRGPLALTPWKNIFMKNDAFCPTVTQYSSYRDHQYDNDCYFIKSSMYFWQPYHIENLERGREVRTGWIERELNTAYRDVRTRRWWRW